MENKRIQWHLQRQSLAMRVLFWVGIVALILFGTNMTMYWQVNHTMQRMDMVYISNVNLTELADALDAVQNNMYDYLTVKASSSLEGYYASVQKYQRLLEKLNDEVIDNPVKLLEKNIRKMSETYLDKTAETVQEKRGRNVEKYNVSYEGALEQYRYLNTYIYNLNSLQLKNNSSSYQTLQTAIRYLEVVSSVILVVMMGACIMILFFMIRGVVSPLSKLASTAKLVGQGNFNVKMPPTDAQDEVGVVTRAFNTMVDSLEEYMKLTKESMEKEQQMIEQELLMEAHLKEAQLKYLQSQINPHFLFNSLNAGAQLAMMEDAEKTCIFVEKMADFFRYNVKKGNENATLQEEVEAVENYIYILNVRFSGEIHFTKEVDESVLNCTVPSMMLQPIVENAVNHGIRNIDWEGRICLKIWKGEENVFISVKDNGKGISQERIKQIFNGEIKESENELDSTGVGMNNVIARLELLYEQKNLMEIFSEGENMGTEIRITVPYKL